MKSIQALREERTAKATECHHLVKETTEWTPENDTRFKELERDIANIDTAIGVIERDLALTNALLEPIERNADRLGISEDEAAAQAKAEKEVFNAWLRGGVEGLSPEQREVYSQHRASMPGKDGRPKATMSTTTDSQGGYTIAEGFGGELLLEMLAMGGVRQAATILPTATGNPLPWPTNDDTSNTGELLAQNVTATAQDLTFGVVPLDAWTYSSKYVTVPIELLQDNSINLEVVLRDLLSTRLGRITNTHYTTGSGTLRPSGIITRAASGVAGASGQLTTFILDNLVDLEHSVDPAYRNLPGTGFMMHDTSLRQIKKLLDGEGRPIWLPGLTSGEPSTILRYPYFINQDMAVPAANAKSLIFGNLKKYMIRDVMAVELFRFTDSAFMLLHSVGFVAFMRTDGDLVAAGCADDATTCVKYFKHAAS